MCTAESRCGADAVQNKLLNSLQGRNRAQCFIVASKNLNVIQKSHLGKISLSGSQTDEGHNSQEFSLMCPADVSLQGKSDICGDSMSLRHLQGLTKAVADSLQR